MWCCARGLALLRCPRREDSLSQGVATGAAGGAVEVRLEGAGRRFWKAYLVWSMALASARVNIGQDTDA